MTAEYHLAQINIAYCLYPIDDPRMNGFTSQLDAINALAESSPGFIWRLQTDEGHSVSIQAYDDPKIIVNMSVWKDVDALFDYTYHSPHVKVFADRNQWFERRTKEPTLALWWIPAGHIPTAEEGKQRLAILAEKGPTGEAFTIKKRFPAPQLPN